MGGPSSTSRRSNTSRGTTSVALPAPNGMVALIRCEGQLSAHPAGAEKRPVRTQATRRDLFIKSSGFMVQSVARTVPLLTEFSNPEIDDAIAIARYKHAVGLSRKLDEEAAVATVVSNPAVGSEHFGKTLIR